MQNQQAVETSASVYTQADVIVDCIYRLGTNVIFGVPGGAIEPLFNAIARSTRKEQVDLIVARHETGAAFMADGYYRETGLLPVVCSTTGPGATNLLTGVASAMTENIPMLVITAQTPLPKFGRRALQESSCTAIDTVSMFQHITVYNSLVSHADQLEHKLQAAIAAAFRLKGPVHLSIPSDVMRSDAVATPINMPALTKTFIGADAYALKAFCHRLSQSNRIAVCIGENISLAGAKEAKKFIEATNASYVCTPMGKAYADETHNRFSGVFGFAGHASAKHLLQDPTIDLIVTIGTTLDELSTSGWSLDLNNDKVVHIDSNAEHFVRSNNALHVYGDIATILVNATAHAMRRRSWKQCLHPIQIREHIRCYDKASPVKPQYLMHRLSELSPDVRMFIDAGNSWAWATHYLNRSETSGYYRIAMGFGSMGWSIGASIGSAVQMTPTMCVVGDGSYLMSGQEITVAAQLNLPVVFVVLNDSAMGMVMHGQRLGNQESIGWELNAVNFADMAKAMGVNSLVVQTSEDLDAIDFDRLLNATGPTLIDVRIDKNEVPPMGDRVKGLSKSVTPGA